MLITIDTAKDLRVALPTIKKGDVLMLPPLLSGLDPTLRVQGFVTGITQENPQTQSLDVFLFLAGIDVGTQVYSRDTPKGVA